MEIMSNNKKRTRMEKKILGCVYMIRFEEKMSSKRVIDALLEIFLNFLRKNKDLALFRVFQSKGRAKINRNCCDHYNVCTWSVCGVEGQSHSRVEQISFILSFEYFIAWLKERAAVWRRYSFFSISEHTSFAQRRTFWLSDRPLRHLDGWTERH